MSRDYGWEDLKKRGDLLFFEGLRSAQVSHLAKSHVRRRLGPRAKVATISTEEGVFVLLAYTPPTYVERVPRLPEQVETPPPARFRDPATSWRRPETPEEPEDEVDGTDGLE